MNRLSCDGRAIRGGRAIDFRVMVGRLVGEAMGAFGALNLPSEKCPVIPNPRADGRWSGGYLFYLHRGRSFWLRVAPHPA